MGFSSFAYIFVVLPLIALVHAWLRNSGLGRLQIPFLAAISIALYAISAPGSAPVLLGSILFNFAAGRALGAAQSSGDDARLNSRRRVILLIALGCNLAVLAYFKYFDRLPLGLSFFTLTQIMYLVDVYERLTPAISLAEQTLLAGFFATVTMGPLLRAKAFLVSVRDGAESPLTATNVARATTLFAIGLFKKVVIADNCSHLADAGFSSPGTLSMLEAWASSIAYSLQLYFDFSGYSDMAVASALVVGAVIPINFKSPYRARSIVEFWQRWHISLSNFITTYLYTPMIRSFRKVTLGNAMIATFLSMLIAGLWHGSTWNFAVFGALHGAGLVVNQLWKRKKTKLPGALAWLITIVYVNLAFIFFRANTIPDALSMVRSLYNVQSVVALNTWGRSLRPLDVYFSALVMLGALMVVATKKSSTELISEWRPTLGSLAFVVALVLASMLFMNSMTAKEFLYVDF